MTETPQAPPSAPPPGGGWNTENLKDYRALRRSRDDRKVAGVAGGLGRHLDIDPTVLRVLFVVLALFGGAGLLLYGVLWLLVPEEGTGRSIIGTSDSTRNALLIGAAVVALLVALGGTWSRNNGFPWLIVAALILLAVMLRRDRRENRENREPAPAVPPPPGWEPEDGPWTPAPVEPDPRRTGPLLFGSTLALLALCLGALGLYDASGGAVSDSAYPALALGVIGLVLVVGAFVGRAGGLIALGLVTTIVLAGTAVSRPSYSGDRDLVLRPTSSAAIRSSYDVPAGRIELDLSRVRDPQALDGRRIDLRANVGEIVLVVPRNVNLLYSAQVAYGGAIDTPTASRNGWGNFLSNRIPPSGPDAANAPKVFVTANLKFGHIEVRQS